MYRFNIIINFVNDMAKFEIDCDNYDITEAGLIVGWKDSDHSRFWPMRNITEIDVWDRQENEVL